MSNETFTKFKPVKLKILRGNDETFIFNLKNSSGSAFVVSGTVVLTVKLNKNDTTSIFTKSISDSSEGNIWVSGKLVLVIPNATTEILPDNCYFDIKQTNGGIVTTLVAGVISSFDTPG